MTKKPNKSELKNASIVTVVSGLAGTGIIRLTDWVAQAAAAGGFEPTATFFQGVFALAAAGGISLWAARSGATTLPFDDSTVMALVDKLGEAADDAENKVTNNE